MNYSYLSATDFVNYLHFSGAAFHPGQGFEIVFLLFSLFAYIIWVQRGALGTLEGRVTTDKSGMPASVQPFGHVLLGDTRGIPARGK